MKQMNACAVSGVGLVEDSPRPVLDSLSAEDQVAGEAGNNELKRTIITRNGENRVSKTRAEGHQRSMVHQAQQTSPALNLQFLLGQQK